jgi:hypothetical protein
MRCGESVCKECVKAYSDVGFAMFLTHADRGSLFHYKENPNCIAWRSRNPWSLEVYNFYQEFKDTAEFRETLKHEIKRAENRVSDLKTKLAASEARAE